MSQYVQSEHIRGVIPPTIGDGLEFQHVSHGETEPHTYRTSVRLDADGLREATLKVNTWIGISSGAYHHYATIEFHGADVRRKGESPNFHYCIGSTPKEAESMEIPVRRIADIRDVEYEINVRCETDDYAIPKPGKDWVRGYWSYQDALDAGKAFFLKHFQKGWKLRIEDQAEGHDHSEILAIAEPAEFKIDY